MVSWPRFKKTAVDVHHFSKNSGSSPKLTKTPYARTITQRILARKTKFTYIEAYRIETTIANSVKWEPSPTFHGSYITAIHEQILSGNSLHPRQTQHSIITQKNYRLLFSTNPSASTSVSTRQLIFHDIFLTDPYPSPVYLFKAFQYTACKTSDRRT
jgi:hypothetical protein